MKMDSKQSVVIYYRSCQSLKANVKDMMLKIYLKGKETWKKFLKCMHIG